MFVLAVVPGMPHLPFLLFSALLGFTGWRMSKRPQAAEAEEKSLETLTRTITETSEQQVSWETIPLIEPISLSLGYKLVALVDKAQWQPAHPAYSRRATGDIRRQRRAAAGDPHSGKLPP